MSFLISDVCEDGESLDIWLRDYGPKPKENKHFKEQHSHDSPLELDTEMR